jgi:hypothetical protein
VRIYADFQKADETGRLVLLCYGTLRDLTIQRERLREGATYTFYMESDEQEDLEADGKVTYVPAVASMRAHWVADIGPIRYVTRPLGSEGQTDPCFGCGLDLRPHFGVHGRDEDTRCPHCDTRIMMPLDPP